MQTRQWWKAQAGVYLVVAFVAAGALGALQPATGIPTEVVQLTQFGPALGVAAAALLWPSLTRELLAGPPAHPPAPWRKLLATPALIILLSAGPYALLTHTTHATDPRGLHHPFLLIALAQLVGACGEEIGWRCFLQPLLRTRFGPLTASAAVGAVWGLWHVQVLARSPAYAVGFLLATIAMSVVLGLALEGVGGRLRLLLAGGFHALVNLGMLLFMDEETGRAVPMVLFGLACAVTAVAWVGLRRGVTIPAAVG
ncbi:CPBP family intramembrane glutamic endopeptidase [Streptomyces diastatochromogenes]|uniref:Abortive phage infection protein n=1 Tax=Streptomyces diastatochromogenes TaxID=42236 RepID=A0A233SSC9_STRDA|nr:CPBP family intramembrane glutamic endopeptidase [Streptomyces diastatochromogenes]OXY98541.1 abortive phage infection protein [Streptomyces diastatochromogenes]